VVGGVGGGGGGGGVGGGGGQVVIIVVAIVLMIIAPILAQLIYFAISRRREYLADASGALYTRYPEGLASALEKIAASTAQLKSANKATAPMYIINPFRSEGRAASDWTSTHPPISERIRILRSMAGGASLTDYDKSYQQFHRSGKGVIPASALGVVSVMAVTPEPEALAGEADKIERARETSDMLWKFSEHRLVNCECGTKLRVPPEFKSDTIQCPHCGRTNPVPPRHK